MTFADPDPSSAPRIDVWLWAARFFRTRALAKTMIDGGKVEVAGQRIKPSQPVRVGEAMRIVRGDEVFEIEVLELSDRRGPASVAQRLYCESASSRETRERRRLEAGAARAGYQPPQSRPDKRARRLINALGDIDAS